MVSIVVATCNRPSELERCLRSLLSQSHPAEKIVVVDDAPGGAQAPKVVADCDGGRSRLHYIEGNGKGLADAHNRGLAEVDSAIVAFADDDIVADEHWLARILEAFAVAPKVGCVTGKIVPGEPDTQARVARHPFPAGDKGG